MITKNIDNNIIHFYQKVVDKRAVLRFTTDFLMRIFALSYKKKSERSDNEETKRIIASIQASLFAQIDKYLKDTSVAENNIIEIKFEKDNIFPIVEILDEDKPSGILVNVFFKKINWEEINEFRIFLIRFLEYYFIQYKSDSIKDEQNVKKLVTEMAGVVQELLQNANMYSIGNYDYELVIEFKENKFIITVYNFADSKNAKNLFSIIKEIKNSTNMQELILKYMLSDNKTLGLISSIYNYNIKTYSAEYLNNEIVKVVFEVEI